MDRNCAPIGVRTKPLHRLFGFAAALILFLALVCGSTPAQVAPKPLSQQDVTKLLKGAVSPKRVGELVRERKIDFEVSPDVERELRAVGADDALIAALRETAPKPAETAKSPPSGSLEINSSPGGAQVFVDDTLIARTSPEGRLVVPGLSSGKHRVRLAL